jgi:hypothetical protein
MTHIVWEKGYEIHYRNLEGSTFSSDTLLSNSNVYAAYPVIATHGDNIYVAWEDLRDGNFEIYLKEFNGIQWSEDKRVTNSTEASLFPSLCVDFRGVVHIVWQEDRIGGYQILYTSYEQGGFTSRVPLVDSPGEATNASIISAGEESHLVWSDSRDGDWEIYYKSYDGTWEDDMRLTHSEGTSGAPSICASDDGSLHILFWDTRDGSAKIHFKERKGTKKADVVTPELTASPNPFTHNVVVEFRVRPPALPTGRERAGSSQPEADEPLAQEFVDKENIVLRIHDVSGRLVKSFPFNHLTIQPFNQVTWDGQDNSGQAVKNGLYFARVTSTEQKSGLVCKIVYLR